MAMIAVLFPQGLCWILKSWTRSDGVFVRFCGVLPCAMQLIELALCKVETLFEESCCLSSIGTTHSMQRIEDY